MTAAQRGLGARAIVKSAIRSGDVSFEARALWLLIESFADKNGNNAFPSLPLLATITGHDVKWVKRKMKELREAGWITSYTRPTKKGRGNVYVLHKAQIGPDVVGPK